MLNKLIFSLILFLTFNKKEILSTPLTPFQFFNGSDVLAYQGFEKQANQNVAENRKKRFLDDIMELLNLFDDYFNTDDNDSSSEEESSEEENLCRICSITYNKINQVQHVHDAAQPLSSQQSKNTIKGQKVLTSTEKSKSKTPNNIGSFNAKSDLKEDNAGQKNSKTSTESLKEPVFTTSTQTAVTKKFSIMTEALPSTNDSLMESTTPQAITTTMKTKEE